MPITIDPYLEAELREKAAHHRQDPQHFAVAAAANLRAVERRADGITDAESRDLLIVSALENLVPRVLKDNKESASFLFYMVLAVLLWMATKDKAPWPTAGVDAQETQDTPHEETNVGAAAVSSPHAPARLAPRLRILPPEEARRQNVASTAHLEAQLAEVVQATSEEVAIAEMEWRTFEHSMNETRRGNGERPLYKEDVEQ